MDVFFVISGLVVTPLILSIFAERDSTSLRKNLGSFFSRRIMRLAPALISCFAVSVTLIYAFAPIIDHQKIAKQILATLLLAGNFGAYYFNGNYFAPNENPFLHTWSLSVEEQIYVALPLFLVAITRIKSIKIVMVFVVLTLLSLTLFLILPNIELISSTLSIGNPAVFTFYSPISRLWEFCIGSLLFFLRGNIEVLEKATPKFINWIFLLALLSILINKFTLNNTAAVLIVVTLTGYVISSKSLDQIPIRLSKYLKWIGDRSYSIYLFHLPLIYVAQQSSLYFNSGSVIRSILLIAIVIITLILAAINFAFVEERYRSAEIHSLLNSNHRVPRVFIIAIFAVLEILMITDIQLIKDRNIPQRSAQTTPSWKNDGLGSTCAFFIDSYDVSKVPCVYKTKNRVGDVLLIGDSNAATFTRTLISVSNESGFDLHVSTLGGCPFILRTENIDLEDAKRAILQECVEHNRKMFGYLKNLKPNLIYYSQSSIISKIEPMSESQRVSILNEISRSLFEISRYTERLLLIGSTPIYSDPPNNFLRVFNGEGFYSKIPKFVNEYWKERVKPLNVKYLDILPIFCNQKGCANKKDGIWLFEDQGHLSFEGTTLIQDILRREILIEKSQ